ncbi:unnamed protein product, partial [marine sediment metagenome]
LISGWIAAQRARGVDADLLDALELQAEALDFYADSDHVGYFQNSEGTLFDTCIDTGERAAATQAAVNSKLGLSL